MMNGQKPVSHNSFRQIPQRVTDFRETPRTVFKTVEGAKSALAGSIPVRLRYQGKRPWWADQSSPGTTPIPVT